MIVSLTDLVSSLHGVGDYQSKLFAQKEIFTLNDLLYFFPKRYEDRSSILKLEESLQKSRENEQHISTVLVTCVDRGSFYFRNRDIPKFIFNDGHLDVSMSAFNPGHRYFKVGESYFLSGKLKFSYNELQINVSDYESFDEDALKSLNMGRIVPVYPSTEGLTQKKIRQAVKEVIEFIGRNDVKIDYQVPHSVISKYRLSNKIENICNLHFPESKESIELSKQALIYEEFFLFQFTLAQKKINEKKGKSANRYPKSELVELLQKKLPFSLTPGQETALDAIQKDMLSATVMRRMLQGEVGSGKTVLALLTMALAVENGFQTALLAPTDILARQHHDFFQQYLCPLGIDCVLLVSHLSRDAKRTVEEQLREGEKKVVIGTHSLIQEKITFFNLAYVVVDEQHRFGVNQREALLRKGEHVDMLMMSATPIPRSLSLSVFGDLDMSQITEVPKDQAGRMTKIIEESERAHAYKFMMSRVQQGEQALIIFPAIDETEKALKSLIKEYKYLKEKVLFKIPSGLIHGRLDDSERQTVMEMFYRGEVKVLASTTVLEVGIHSPNATVILIEAAERYGLSQLHQLRGRVGRGKKKGYCYLIPSEGAPLESLERLEKFSQTHDGFEIAELDLSLRGPGDFLGTRQSGDAGLKLGDFVRDFQVLKRARSDAQKHALDLFKRKEGSPASE